MTGFGTARAVWAIPYELHPQHVSKGSFGVVMSNNGLSRFAGPRSDESSRKGAGMSPKASSGSRSKDAIPLLRVLLGELRAIDPNRLDSGLEKKLERLWQDINGRLSDIFGHDGLRFHMFRQPSFASALGHIVGEKRTPDALLVAYRHLIGQLIGDVESAIIVLEKGEAPRKV